MKKTFIPLECDIFNDNRICALLNNMGPAGCGIYMILVVELRNRKDYCLDGQSLKVIARHYNIRRKMLQEVLYNYDLFIIERMPDDDILVSSDYVTSVMSNYDAKVEQSKVYGKIGAEKRWSQTDRVGHSHPLAKEKNTKEKNKKENKTTEVVEDKHDTTAADDDDSFKEGRQSNERWKDYLAEAKNDREWVECQSNHSGLHARFFQHESIVFDVFVKHVITHGKERELLSTGDVKFYFANFVRQGTPTNQQVIEALNKKDMENPVSYPYRHEDVDPVTGERSYFGKPIPPDAPPRPDRNAVWAESVSEWI